MSRTPGVPDTWKLENEKTISKQNKNHSKIKEGLMKHSFELNIISSRNKSFTSTDSTKSKRVSNARTPSTYSRTASAFVLPGTKRQKSQAPSTILNPVSDEVICCIYENCKDASPRVGLSILNYVTGEVVISDYIDTQIFIRTVHKIQVYSPTEILIPSTSLSPVVSKLSTIIKYNVPEPIRITEAHIKTYDISQSWEMLNKYNIFKENEKQKKFEEFRDKDYGLASLAACLNFCKESSCGTKFEKIRIKLVCAEHTCLIDPKTIKNMELVSNLTDKNGISFFKFLNHTVTKMGRRLLRINILQPLTNKDAILSRIKAVCELKANGAELLSEMRSTLLGCQDLDIIFSKLLILDKASISADQKINFVILLKTSVEITLKIKKLLAESSCDLLSEVRNICGHPDIISIQELINDYINEDCTWDCGHLNLQNQKLYAVKSDSNGLLDISRKIYESIVADIINEIGILSKDHNLNLDYYFDSSRGFYLRLKKKDFSESYTFPEIFINRVVRGNYIEFSTLDIMKLNMRLHEVTVEIILITEGVINDLLHEITQYISTLFMVSESLAILDLLCSFVYHIVKNEGYCVPEFSNKLVLKDLRHPILEKRISNFVSNDVVSIRGSSLIHIITGCNMSGKSVYLKQIVFAVILAQIGCFVPASYACFPVYEKIHARLCHDEIEINSSTFCTEMREMAYFLDDIDEKSLLIIDELGRGSSINDGFAISLAITEYLTGKSCTVFLSTHFIMIPKLLLAQPSVVHLEMVSELENTSNTVKMTYKISDGRAATMGHHGLKIVQSLFPKEILKEARRIITILEESYEQDTRNFMEVETSVETNKIKQINNLASLLEIFSESTDGCVSVRSLKDLQDEFLLNFDVDW
ncbi:MutS family protein MSH4 SCDLUD_000702 [Saccharomycodes ludwigii]|uniref:MutS family protein MSH4 n=1 Tax=Saccharomycodes ludwigii TaxID=36035 RepID=UPI001E87C705|nr:hypothetical protein SCDLUD_000702 [Saccharomycodes ludwigii]KAH3903091.1 hypothetical protein SCDLUD_000702 [Saccharomycodes ludwigii]